MFLEYRPGTSFFHRMDVRTKLLVFVVAVVLTFQFAHPLPNALLAVGSLLLLPALGVPGRQVGKLLAPLAPVVVLILVFAALSRGPGDFDSSSSARVLVHLWFGDGLPLTVGGLAHGANLGLRILTMVCLTAALIVSTPVEHFVALMRMARLPFPVVFIVMTALRFVPTMQHRANQVLDAQRARGAKIDGGMIGAIRAYTTIMVPLFSTGIRMSEELAAAMLNRGYGITRQPTALTILRPTWRDPAIAVVTAVVVGVVVWARLTGWGSL
ncbi:energy-coupling factor transporter transmembrane component T family protein [Micromonospora sp. NPDC047620]|uniref:energy-coupling factor transporter transmembrane component T family protein n=1 Tax=Micromonospora sp. NPDC047620 TaxID=3364251 RepID=UPI0037100272